MHRNPQKELEKKINWCRLKTISALAVLAAVSLVGEDNKYGAARGEVYANFRRGESLFPNGKRPFPWQEGEIFTGNGANSEWLDSGSSLSGFFHAEGGGSVMHFGGERCWIDGKPQGDCAAVLDGEYKTDVGNGDDKKSVTIHFNQYNPEKIRATCDGMTIECDMRLSQFTDSADGFKYRAMNVNVIDHQLGVSFVGTLNSVYEPLDGRWGSGSRILRVDSGGLSHEGRQVMYDLEYSKFEESLKDVMKRVMHGVDELQEHEAALRGGGVAR